MDTTHKQEYRIRDLPTKSVTLFPTRAQIVREIKDVSLKPGANEITVVGLTPTTDEHSIKVEGTGSAIITDITVELLPNREIFEDIYPESDDEEEDKSEEEEEDDAEKVNEALDDVRDKIQALADEQKRAKETVSSAESRLKFLDAYGHSLDKKKEAVDIEASVETYRKEREKVFQDHMDGTIRDRDLSKEIRKLRTEEQRLQKLVIKEREKAAKAKAKIARAKAKEEAKELRRKAERIKEKNRVRKERENFWPRFCYSVRITLDAASFTPSSSRRSSIASASDVKVMVEKEAASEASGSGTGQTCDLSLSYVTSSAFWSPSYDLALSTTANTAMLCFDAQLTNMTSETWTNSRVTLSTSQTTFSGLQDAIPTLVPWRVKLAGKWAGGVQNELIDSKEERDHQGVWQAAQMANHAQKPRAQYFGLNEQPFMQPQARNMLMQKAAPVLQAQQVLGSSLVPQQQQKEAFGMPRPAPPAGAAFGSTGFGASNTSNAGGLFGSASNTENFASSNIAPQMNSRSLKSKKVSRGAGIDFYGESEESASYPLPGEDEEEDDGRTILEPTPELSFQESAFEETGLTATYDLPNLKTLKPSSTASKQRVARISFSNVYFSHTVVAKYKPAAYLKAKLRNTSKLTLLKGPTGLTLDGTFMGRSTLPRCSAGDTFTMSLGVDPAIKVAYPKPDVKRSTTGVFTKGDNSVYTRTVTLVNTRATAGKPVNITVLDQVPVSEDEKLRIDILHPRGLYAGSGVATGVPGKEGKEEKDWGKATATLKKAGEVSWDVVLNAGRSARLTLEYDVAFPTGDRVVQC
ncbi:hypothetical protein QBC34DRAFT_392873 [Podospora aff. communis PSN243]|uniref:Mucoidy inhibitor-like protein n=1 Tax=Podospora aff. communis PSN243 TaxID=3040156 RepID=A0AAV9H2F8_9PEZI|nr:hypothetical protein QBC34DRAFT_392873 [Podospora aff. communis PSN243]